MKKDLQSNFTTPEQSKRLLDMGVPSDSADLYCVVKNNYTALLSEGVVYSLQEQEMIKVSKTVYREELKIGEDILPCWSVGRLMEIYSTCIKDDAGEYWPLHSSVESVGFTFIEHVINRFVIDDIDFSKLNDE